MKVKTQVIRDYCCKSAAIISIVLLCSASVADSPIQRSADLSNESTETIASLVASASMSTTEKMVLQEVFSGSYTRKEELVRIVCGKFQLMRFVASFPTNMAEGELIVLDSPQQPPLTNFEMPVVVIFTQGKKIEGWQMVAPGSSGLVSVTFSGSTLTLLSKANWIVRSNRFEYRLSENSLELIESEVLPLAQGDKPILGDGLKVPAILLQETELLRLRLREDDAK